MRILLLMILTTFTSLQAFPIRTAYINYSTFVESPNDRPSIEVVIQVSNLSPNQQTVVSNVSVSIIPSGFQTTTNTAITFNTISGYIIKPNNSSNAAITQASNIMGSGDTLLITYANNLAQSGVSTPLTRNNSSNLIPNTGLIDSPLYGAGLYVAKILVTGTITVNDTNTGSKGFVTLSGSIAKPGSFTDNFRNEVKTFSINEGKPL